MTNPNIHCEFYKKRGCTCCWCEKVEDPSNPNNGSSSGSNGSKLEMSRSYVKKLIADLNGQTKNMTSDELLSLLKVITNELTSRNVSDPSLIVISKRHHNAKNRYNRATLKRAKNNKGKSPESGKK